MVLNLVVRIDDQSADAMPHDSGAGLIEDRLDSRRLVIKPDEVEVIGRPGHRLLQLGFGHSLPRAIPERQPEMLLRELSDVLGGWVFEAAYRDAPAVLMSEVDRERVGEFGLAAVRNAGHDRHLAGANRHQLVD